MISCLDARGPAGKEQQMRRTCRPPPHQPVVEAQEFQSLLDEELQPRLPQTAQRQAAGQIGAEYMRIIRKFFDELTDAVDDEPPGAV
jgi:hypothetical protein